MLMLFVRCSIGERLTGERLTGEQCARTSGARDRTMDQITDRVKGQDGLTDRQRELIRGLAKGLSIRDASRVAGYVVVQGAIDFLERPQGALALHRALVSRLNSGAGVAMNLLDGVIRGTIPAPAGARVTAALAWLDRSGFTAAKQQEIQASNRPKALSEMTVDELRAAVSGLRQLAQGKAPAPDASLEDMLS